MSRHFATALALIGACVFGGAVPVHAQLFGVQGVWVPASDARLASWGVASDFGIIVPHGSLGIWGAIGAEYQRQRENGPGRGRVSADLRFLPLSSQSSLLPFVGGSVSANRSGGELSEWPGTRTGLDALAGLLYDHNQRSSFAFTVQERFGYVVGQPHAFATEAGLRYGWH